MYHGQIFIGKTGEKIDIDRISFNEHLHSDWNFSSDPVAFVDETEATRANLLPPLNLPGLDEPRQRTWDLIVGTRLDGLARSLCKISDFRRYGCWIVINSKMRIRLSLAN